MSKGSLKDQLDEMLESKGLSAMKSHEEDDSAVVDEGIDNTPAVIVDEIEEAVILANDWEENGDETDVPDDDRYDEANIVAAEDTLDDVEESSEADEDGLTFDDLEAENPSLEAPVNLIDTYGVFAAKQKFTLGFSQQLDIVSKHEDETTELTGQLMYQLRLSGTGDEFDNSKMQHVVGTLFSENGIRSTKVDNADSFAIAAMSGTLVDNANRMRKSGKRLLAESADGLDYLLQSVSEKSIREDGRVVLVSALTCVMDYDEDDYNRQTAYLSIASVVQDSYNIVFHAILRNTGDLAKKFEFAHDLEHMWSAFNTITSSANIANDMAFVHKTLGATKWFSGYTIHISHAGIGHNISSSFNWSALDAANLSS